MKIAIWNVNSIKARLEHLKNWLAATQPDLVLLQELKCTDDNFPLMELQAAGYQAHIRGQKTYNGVAVLHKGSAKLRCTDLPEAAEEEQARYIEVECGSLIIGGLYAPNGNPLGTEKFDYKLNWLNRLYNHTQTLLKTERPFLLGGDFNIIPEAQDACTISEWKNDALFQPESRAMWRKFLDLGLTDAYRAQNPDDHNAFTFWDYQRGAWQKDNGIRIDHFLLSPEAADLMQNCTIDRTPRGWEKASDHTPVILELAI